MSSGDVAQNNSCAVAAVGAASPSVECVELQG